MESIKIIWGSVYIFVHIFVENTMRGKYGVYLSSGKCYCAILNALEKRKSGKIVHVDIR